MNRTEPHRSADVAVGYATDRTGNGIAYAHITSGTGGATVRVPFSVAFPGDAGLHEAARAFAAVTSVGAYLRGRGFTRVRLALPGEDVVSLLNARVETPPPLASAYVKTRCVLHGFASVRVEHAAPGEVHALSTRARADVSLRSVTPEATT